MGVAALPDLDLRAFFHVAAGNVETEKAVLCGDIHDAISVRIRSSHSS